MKSLLLRLDVTQYSQEQLDAIKQMFSTYYSSVTFLDIEEQRRKLQDLILNTDCKVLSMDKFIPLEYNIDVSRVFDIDGNYLYHRIMYNCKQLRDVPVIIYDHDMIFFKNWALKNGYIHKYEQSARSENIFVTSQNPDPIRIDLTVKLDNHICDYYPYIDSFKFYSRKLGTLSNSEYFSYKYILVQNDGGLVPKEEEEPEYDDQSVDW